MAEVDSDNISPQSIYTNALPITLERHNLDFISDDFSSLSSPHKSIIFNLSYFPFNQKIMKQREQTYSQLYKQNLKYINDLLSLNLLNGQIIQQGKQINFKKY